ncbi:hypothetical protein CO674_22920 [Rhizobium hidalgonense]|uniref:Uncharacterized protein n=1 Tax=Rhizobium hidalgonense TaxID=1538159 RepID=A0ABX4JR68_9HYPH|nr:hypothetical protein CO674_22920 [Rhizobium hidalgonense]PON08096.1 hypothetical protein ATY29_08500 [Rhizobium hidalgonense]
MTISGNNGASAVRLGKLEFIRSDLIFESVFGGLLRGLGAGQPLAVLFGRLGGRLRWRGAIVTSPPRRYRARAPTMAPSFGVASEAGGRSR